MNVEVNIMRSDNVESHESESYSLPLHAIFYDKSGNPQVWVLQKDSTVKATPIEIGEPLTNGKIRILSGLNGGEQIVRAGVNSLQPGEKVKIIEDAKRTNVGSLL
jgi:multidrug efflux pump subunit AcrA (membrane-fusion protein)